MRIQATSAFLILSATFLSQAAEPALPDTLRLGTDPAPLSESVFLDLDPARDGYSGTAEVELAAKNPFRSFRLHAQDLSLGQAVLEPERGTPLRLAARTVDSATGLVSFEARDALPPGAYHLRLDFSARFRRDGTALYKSVDRGDPYLFTQFEGTYARQAFPCWDEPAFKIPWRVTVKVPKGLVVVSNAPVADRADSGAASTVSFGRTPPLPSYLVALAVGPFDERPVPGLPVPGRILTPRGRGALSAEAVRVSPRLLSSLERYFGIPYPYPKLDQLAIPEYVFGAMEHPGLITYTDHTLLSDPTDVPLDRSRYLSMVAAHEMAHMWFGNLVTMRWWNDLWLNEAFADWLCAKIVDREFPEMRARFQQLRGVRSAMRTDALASAPPIRREVRASSDFARLADDLTYSKGKGILAMVENWVGEDAFREAVRRYCRNNAWSNAEASDFWKSLGETSGSDIARLMAGYIEQPGIPLVSISVDGKPGSGTGRIRISQRRFSNAGQALDNHRWRVPIVLRWAKDGTVRKTRLLLTDSVQSFDVPGIAGADWIYPNADETGYYRWSLSKPLAERLAAHAGELGALERSGWLDDASELVSAGLDDGPALLSVVRSLATDSDPDIATAVAVALLGIKDLYVDSASAGAYRKLCQGLVRPNLDRIGFEPVPGEPAPNRPLRGLYQAILGLETSDSQVVAACRARTRSLLAREGSVDQSLLDASTSVAAYHGDAILFREMVDGMTRTRSPAERGALTRALGCFRDTALARRARELSLTPLLNSTEFLTVAKTQANIPVLREAALAWAMDRYPSIADKAPPEHTARLIGMAWAADPGLFAKFHAFLVDPVRRTDLSAFNLAKASDRFALRQDLIRRQAVSMRRALSATSP